MRTKSFKTLGQKIKKLRKKRNLAQVELAVIIKVSPSYIGAIEQGVRYPSLKVLEKLARALKVPAKELFD